MDSVLYIAFLYQSKYFVELIQFVVNFRLLADVRYIRTTMKVAGTQRLITMLERRHV